MNISIIGGSGRMGKWLARFLKKEGFDVTIIGRDSDSVQKAGLEIGCRATTDLSHVAESQVIILSVAINAFEEAVKKLAPLTHENQMIFDITSVKMMPVEIMNNTIIRGTTLGTHPVFGPGARGVSGQNFVLTPTNDRQMSLAEKAGAFLEKRSAHVRTMSPEEHDRLMAVILGLAHFISIISASTLVDYGELEKLSSVQGVTYRALLTLIESVLSEDPELYASLQMNLPHLKNAQDLLIENAKRWSGMVSQKDRESFVDQMVKLRERFEKNNPDFGKAYDNMYRLVDR